jgi:GNAT superfamily N-acetyltransferase
MRIDYLADHPELAPILAAWHHAEWQALLPGWTLAQAEAGLRSHTGRRQVPTTVVAVEGEEPLGSASLLEADLDDWDHLSPWLASVFVRPDCRGRGLGQALVTRAVEEAAALGVGVLYLFTAGQVGFYEKLGWGPWVRTWHHGTEVVIMRRRVVGALSGMA